MDDLKKEVLRANMYLYANNLVYGTQGNVSGLDIRKKRIYIKPSGVEYENLSVSMITSVCLNGKPVRGNSLKPSVDTPHHLFLYTYIEGIGGVCHTHSRFATVFSVLGVSVPVLTTGHADVFGTEIPVTGYVDNTGEKIGRAILRAYEQTGCKAVIVGNHGVFSFGENPMKSAFYALMAEYCAEVAYYSLSAGKHIGRVIKPLEKKEIKKWHDRYKSSRYGQK